ncbi:MAG: uroporphyrinogen decarboxylase family protein [bacterium]
MNAQMFEPLKRAEVIKAVERKNPSRIPMILSKWWAGVESQHGARMAEFDRYPEDVVALWINNPVNPERMGLSWEWKTGGAHDSACVIDDWAKLDEFIAKLPDPQHDPQLEELAAEAAKGRAEDRYLLFSWWHLFFERPWMLRGMENLMCDYYTEPDNIHKLHNALAGTYCRYIREAARLFAPDGLWTSDDLGHQTGPMMSPDIFRDMLLPYYQIVSAELRKCKMHFWLHSCGDNTPLLPHLIDGGVNVFHPVQKHTMDERSVAAQFGDRITFLAGIDVQHTLQEKTPAEVRQEVRFLIDTFDRAGGGMGLAAGNGIVAGTPLENIRAFLDEAMVYGQAHRRNMNAMAG